MATPKGIFPGSVVNYQQGVKSYYYPGLGAELTEAIGVVDFTSTLGTVFEVKFRSGQADKADAIGLTIPTGARIHYMGLKVPAGLIATTNDRLKLATAVGATGTQAFNASATTAYVASVAANNSTFEVTPTQEDFYFHVSPFDTTGSSSLSAPATFRVYSENGSNATGSGVRTASGTLQGVVVMRWWNFNNQPIPSLEQIFGKPARQTVN